MSWAAWSSQRAQLAPPLLLSVVFLTACASAPVDQVDLMPAPDVYNDGMLNPLPLESPFERIPYQGILYATDRAPATEEDREKYYRNDRGNVMRVGVARVKLGDKQFEWEKARIISMLRARTEEYPIKVENADEWGLLDSTVPPWINLDRLFDGNPPPDATQRMANAINVQMEQSGKKDVYIYVHGYKVVYENPILVASELWHFLGYEGAFIAYAWPSTPSRWAYIKDSDTSDGYARHFRLLLEFLAESTEVENIHVVAYSNGTRLVTRAMEQLALINQGRSREEILERHRINNVILVGSDLDRGVFSAYVSDGLLNVSRRLSIYLSKYDKALGVSQYLTRRQRLGQLWGGKGGELGPEVRHAIERLRDRISFINVSDAEGAGTGNGHGYFRSSPWASSDVLMTLTYGLSPTERGLVEQEDLPVYAFPPDYLERLWDAIDDVDPEFAESYQQFKAAQNAQSATQ